MKKQFLLFYLLMAIFYALPLKAQINESDTSKFQLRASLTGNYQQGNVEVLTIKSKIDFSVSPLKNWVIKSQNSSLYQEFYSVEADNDIFSRNYIYFRPQNKIYPFVIAYISTNYRRKINSRYFVGGGSTWQVINTSDYVLKLSASLVYESSKFSAASYNYPEYNGSAKINLYRGTLYSGGWDYLFQKHLRFYYDAYWQPAIDNGNNYRWLIDGGLDFLVWKGLSFNTLYTFTHENVTINNIKQDDKILSFGLSYYLKIKNK